jgi:hypothetical protein
MVVESGTMMKGGTIGMVSSTIGVVNSTIPMESSTIGRECSADRGKASNKDGNVGKHFECSADEGIEDGVSERKDWLI